MLRRKRQLRRPDSNRRRTAYETVLETRLQSTPQNLRMKDEKENLMLHVSSFILPPSSFHVVSAGFEPAISTMSRWRALRAAPRAPSPPTPLPEGERGEWSRAGRSRTCLEPRIR